MNLTYMHTWRCLYRTRCDRQIEVSYHGALVRWGTFLQNDIGSPTINPGFPGIPAFRPGPKMNWYFFGGVEERAMAR